MNVDEFYNYITQHMTAEEALKKLLSSSLITYEKLKFEDGEEIHPELIMAMAALDRGWGMLIERPSVSSIVRGICMGTPEYLEANHSKHETEDEEPAKVK